MDEQGISWSQPEPELDWVDIALLDGWWRLNDNLCQQCGRPREVHDDETDADYHAGFEECPATVALLAAQTKKRLAYEREREAAFKADKWSVAAHMPREQALSWVTWTDDEGKPS